LLACAIITALFSAQQFPNLVEGFQIQFTVLYFLVSGAILAMLCAAEHLAPNRLLTRTTGEARAAQQEIPSLDREGAVWFAISAMCALAASYSSANGLLCWPLLLALAIWLRMPGKYRLALAVGLVVVTVLYMWGYTTPPRHSRPLEELTHNFPGVLIRAATFLGSVTEGIYAALSSALGLSATSRIVVAATFGFAGMALTVWAAILLWRKRDRFTNGHAGSVLIAVFVVLTAGMVGMGRGFLPVTSALDARYKSHSLVFWIALGAFYWRMLQPRIPGLLFNAGVAALIVSFIPIQRYWLPYSKQVGATYREIESAIGADVFDAPVWRKSFPFAPGESAIIGPVDYLRQNHLSLFTEAWTGWTGQPLNALFAIDRSRSCQVSIDSMTSVDTQIKPGWRVSGHTSQPGTVILTDPAGRIAGVVRNSDGASWNGYVAGAERRTLKPYVLEPDGHSICGQ